MASSTIMDDEVINLRLKAAIHYTVGQICDEIATEMDMKYDRWFIAALSELAFKQCQNFAIDLELFAKHAKRMTITPDDVKMIVRKSPPVLEYITDQLAERSTSKENAAKKASKKPKTKSTAARARPDDTLS